VPKTKKTGTFFSSLKENRFIFFIKKSWKRRLKKEINWNKMNSFKRKIKINMDLTLPYLQVTMVNWTL